MRLSVIIPTLDEETAVAAAVRSAAGAHEVIVVDGGSTDATVDVARSNGALVITSARGRGRQLGVGAEQASGDVLLFLHADTSLPPGFHDAIALAMASGDASWGRFDIRFDDGGPLVHLIARLISIRSRLSRVATGDQAIFVRREVFRRCGGFREALLFEDVDLCRRLKRVGRMVVPSGHVVTSARRWRQVGAWRASLLMWGLKLLYLAGVPSGKLARHYRHVR